MAAYGTVHKGEPQRQDDAEPRLLVPSISHVLKMVAKPEATREDH